MVLTTGTFLKGLIHIGERKFPAGRTVAGRSEFTGEGVEPPSIGLSKTLYGLGLRYGPAQDRHPASAGRPTIDWAALGSAAGR